MAQGHNDRYGGSSVNSALCKVRIEGKTSLKMSWIMTLCDRYCILAAAAVNKDYRKFNLPNASAVSKKYNEIKYNQPRWDTCSAHYYALQ